MIQKMVKRFSLAGILFLLTFPAEAVDEFGAQVRLSASPRRIDMESKKMEIHQSPGFGETHLGLESTVINDHIEEFGNNGSYTLEGHFFYEHYLAIASFNRLFSRTAAYETYNYMTASDETIKADGPMMTEASLRLGLRNFKRGGRTNLALLGGLHQLYHSGPHGILDGSTTFATGTLIFSPSWQMGRNVDFGIDLELTAGGAFYNQGLQLFGYKPHEIFKNSLGTGIYGAGSAGVHLFFVRWGLGLDFRVRVRYFETKVYGVGSQTAMLESMDFQGMEFGIFYRYTNVHYNKK